MRWLLITMALVIADSANPQPTLAPLEPVGVVIVWEIPCFGLTVTCESWPILFKETGGKITHYARERYPEEHSWQDIAWIAPKYYVPDGWCGWDEYRYEDAEMVQLLIVYPKGETDAKVNRRETPDGERTPPMEARF